jgi:hypothetical protein
LFLTAQTKLQSKTISSKQLNQILGRVLTRGPLPFDVAPLTRQQINLLMTPTLIRVTPKMVQHTRPASQKTSPLLHTHPLNA